MIKVCLVAAAFSFASCNNDDKKEPETKAPAIVEENITYTADGVNMNGYVAYDSNISGKRPAVLIIHEWWGLNDYSKKRARQLAELGYIAMAVDLYGNGKTADNPDSAGSLAGPFYGNPGMAKTRFDAALNKLKTYSQTGDKVAAIGYCFGGAMALSIAKLGEDLAGVVCFHGNLNVVPANKDLLKAKVLVCNGGDDPFVAAAEVATFKKQMDSIGATYTFKSYPGAVHAFTNPDADAIHAKFPKMAVAYNAAADTASWKEMKDFFGTIFK
jgi:dienelactone hydrolase